MRCRFVLVGILVCLALERPAARAQGVPSEYRPAVAKDFAWLVERQNKDGSWSDAANQSDVVCTAAAGLALLMEGSTAARGKYVENLRRALEWMKQNCREDGLVGASARQDRRGPLAGQGYAVLFLASALAREGKVEGGGLEARLARVRRQELEDTLQRAVRFTVRAQADNGGWGLAPAPAGGDEAPSTLLQVLALQAARQAGAPVPGEALPKAYAYLEKLTTPNGGLVYSSFQAGRAGGERPGDTVAAFACCYGSDGVRTDLLKKWLAYSETTFSPRLASTAEQFYLAVAMHGLGDEGHAKLFGNRQRPRAWSKERGLLLGRFRGGPGAVHRDWDPSPVFGTAINLIALQLDNDVLPVWRTRRKW